MRRLLPLVLLLIAAPLAAQSWRPSAEPAEARLGFGSDIAMSGNELYAARTGTVSILPAPPVHPGTVLVFRRDGDAWTETAKVTATDVALTDEFGAAIAVSGDWMAVGAPGQGVGGAVYLFQRKAGAWTQAARLAPPQPAPGDGFGTALALDGDRLVIGAPGADSTRGAAFASRRDARSGTWSPAVKFATGAEVSDRLGEAVALAGSRALVGAPGLLRGGNNPFAPPGSQRVKAGAAFVYVAGTGGAWTREAALEFGADTARSFGAALLLDGDDAFVGAPRSSKAAGAVYAYRRSGSTWRQVARLRPAGDEPLTGFGSALARAGADLLVGAPIRGRNAGGVYVFRRGTDGGWTEAQALAFEGTGNSMAGSRLAAHGEHAVATAPLADNGMGLVVAYRREGAAGTWKETGRVVDSPVEMAKVTGGEVRCASGKAGSFECQQVDLLAYLPLSAIGARRGINVNDIWGWTDPQTGREYALLGRMDGTSFVDVTDPANPRYLGDLPMHQGAHPNFWRDIKVYKDHAFIVADGSGPHGMQVFDLTQLRDVQGAPVTFSETAHYDRIASAHNIAINEESGYAYPIGANGGGETCGGALHMIDIREPRSPKFAGCFADPTTGNQRTGYTHDTQCVTYRGPDTRYTGREICFNSSETAVGIADVTDKANPRALSTASYPNVAYTHQGWLSEDQKYFYVDDEGDEISGNVPRTRTLVWDVTKLDEPVLVKEFLGTTSASDHNLYVKGKYVYQSNYLAGLRILDISDPANPRETGFFDTVPAGENKPGFAGSWSNYPYFKSGTIVVSSIGEGLFVLRHRPEEPAVP